MKPLSALFDGVTGANPEIAGLTADSRAVKPGFVFAALPGTKADGRAFIAQAEAAGAAAILGPPGTQSALPVIVSENPRRALSLAAARFFDRQPRLIAAVTGTNGKSSIVAFLRQIFAACGHQAASMGTVGIVSPKGERALSHTTPDPVAIHETLDQLAGEGVTHLALEASSHGLDQFRLDGVRISAAAFTNLTRDHLDYHPSFEAYREAKLRLFGELLPAGGVAVVDADSEEAVHFAVSARARGQTLITTGAHGADIAMLGREAALDGQTLKLKAFGKHYDVHLPLAGAFQANNALVAAGLAIGCGESPARVFEALAALKGAKGRMDLVARAANGAPVFVDYAHTPDAVATVLKALRPHVQGKLHVILGCGGDRDPGKRPLMGRAAAETADAVIVTDDNPRSEDPAAIRAAVLIGAPGAREIGDRAEAIAEGIKGLGAGDILVIAGKGHEAGQIAGNAVLPFDDTDEARKAALAMGGSAA
jgi:UDP-N-acetylmuramoyl-L-alanyl-D-glutamate--2,6-diaminopimelate ligase